MSGYLFIRYQILSFVTFDKEVNKKLSMSAKVEPTKNPTFLFNKTWDRGKFTLFLQARA